MSRKPQKLTEKMKAFCREYIANGGNGVQAYLAAYDSDSKVSANVESTKLLKRPAIQEYLTELRRPLEDNAIQMAMSEREKKRQVLWDIINKSDNDGDRCRALDILNKMDNEYININRNIEDSPAEIINLDTDSLRKFIGTG